MNRRTALLWALLIVPAVGVLLLYLTLLLFPTSDLVRLSIRHASRYGLSLTVSEVAKTLPLGIRAQGVSISGERGPLVSFDRLDFQLRILPLFAGRVIVNGTGIVAGGRASGEVEATGPGRFAITCNDLRLEELPALSQLSPARITGRVTGNGTIRGTGRTASGEMRLSVDDLGITGAAIGGVMLPDIARQSVRAVVGINGGSIRLDNVALQGEGLYARLRGEIQAGGNPGAAPLNLALELMPKPDFMERQKGVFLLLAKYSDSPGHYLLPIRGTLGTPELR